MSEGIQRIARVLAVAGPLLLMLMLAWTPGISFTEDLGRHLLLGRIIVEQQAVPRTNLLTYTHPDFPFVNHHWLSEVFFYLMHRVGGLNGLIVFKVLAMVGALGLAMGAAPLPRRHVGLCWFAGLLAAVLMGFRSHLRPELFTYLGIGFFLFCLERLRCGARWPWWAMPVYLWFWSNAQIYFIFGLFMCAAFAFERACFESGKFQVSSFRFRWVFVWLIGLLVACVLNPNGLSGLLYPFRIFSNYGVGITENASPLEYWRTVVNPMMLALPLLSVLTLISIPSCWRTRPANAVIALVALAASWRMARSVPLLALTAMPCIATAWGDGVLEDWSAGKRSIFSKLRHSVAPLLLLFNLLLIFSVLSGSYSRVFPSPIAPTPFGFDDESRYVMLRKLKDAGLRGPVFTDYNIGSLVEYNLHPEPGYVDNRPEAFPAAFWRTEYVPALALGEVWDRVCASRGINAVVVSLTGVKESFTRELMIRPEWRLAHVDGLCGVWVRNVPANQPLMGRVDPRAYAADIAARIGLLGTLPFWRRQVEADRIVYELYSLICIGEVPLAWPGIWRMHELYPDYQVVHELMRVSAPPERVEAVKQVMAREARWPVAAKQVLDWGRVLEAEGRWAAARGVYQRGRCFFPLSADLRDALNRVEDAEYLVGSAGR